jgi:hypothetical protein
VKYRAFIRALGIPDGVAAHQLFDAAVRDGVKTTGEAKRIFLETKRADMRTQLKAANEEGQRRRRITDRALSAAVDAANRYELPPLPEG